MPDSSASAAACDQYTGITISNICSLFTQDVLLTGVLRDILIRHFLTPNVIEEPDLRELIWKTGDDTGILIEALHRWRPGLTEKRPGVIINRNAYENQKIGVGDLQQGGYELAGDSHYSTFWVGSHTLFCIGGTGQQAELLAMEVQRELTEFGPLIREFTQLIKFQTISRGPVSLVEEATQNFVVPVTVGAAFNERWVLRKQAPKLRRISLSLLEEC